MSRIWFSQDLETVATYWRICRFDGVTLGFTSHDADLWFDGVLHQAAPGMMPAAIRRTAGFDDDSAEVQGAISHEAIGSFDLLAGRFDQASIVVGLVDWQSLEQQPIYSGVIGSVSDEAGSFVAELQSRKSELQRDPTPRTSPTCRANFCGLGCGLSAAHYEHEAMLISHNLSDNTVMMGMAIAGERVIGGALRWLDGPYAGLAMGVIGLDGDALLLDRPMDVALAAGLRAVIREGCDHTLASCAERFGNVVNFQGEPFLPGNDLVLRYGVPS